MYDGDVHYRNDTNEIWGQVDTDIDERKKRQKDGVIGKQAVRYRILHCCRVHLGELISVIAGVSYRPLSCTPHLQMVAFHVTAGFLLSGIGC